MAIAGNSIKAPHCTIVRGLLTINWQTTSRTNCVSVQDAVRLLAAGERAIVMPDAIQALREAWDAHTT